MPARFSISSSTDFLSYHTWATVSYYSLPSSSGLDPPSLSSIPSPQPILIPPGNPSALPPFRRRVLLDDFGWVPVVPIDQRPDPGRLGRGREGGGGRPPPAGLWKQPLPQLGRGSSPADPHVPSSQLRARRCEIRHLSATARQRPAPPPA